MNHPSSYYKFDAIVLIFCFIFTFFIFCFIPPLLVFLYLFFFVYMYKANLPILAYLESFTDAVVVSNSMGIIVGINSAAEKMFGFSHGVAKGQVGCLTSKADPPTHTHTHTKKKKKKQKKEQKKKGTKKERKRNKKRKLEK